MAQNNVTEVVNGIVQPRFYQVYGDLIESKEVMEPLAITAGTGPICGFDWVDTTQQNVTITSVFKKPSTLPSGVANILGRARRVFLSNKDNTAGQVFNAYTTPDGLCHIAPDVLTFNGVQPSGGWPSLSNPQKLVAFAVKATHTYRPDGSENPPSVTNFTCGWLTFDKVYGLDEVLSWDYERMLELLADSGMPFNKNVDSLIGVYLVGWRPEWNSQTTSMRYKSIMAAMNYTLCLVPIQGQFPVKPYGMNPLDILDLKSRVQSVESKLDSTNIKGNSQVVDSLAITQGNGVEVDYELSKIDTDSTGIQGTVRVAIKSLKVKGVTLFRDYSNPRTFDTLANYIYDYLKAIGIWGIKNGNDPDTGLPIYTDWGLTIMHRNLSKEANYLDPEDNVWSVNGGFTLPDRAEILGTLCVCPYNSAVRPYLSPLLPEHSSTVERISKDPALTLAVAMDNIFMSGSPTVVSTPISQYISPTTSKGTLKMRLTPFGVIFIAAVNVAETFTDITYITLRTRNLYELVGNNPKWLLALKSIQKQVKEDQQGLTSNPSMVPLTVLGNIQCVPGSAYTCEVGLEVGPTIPNPSGINEMYVRVGIPMYRGSTPNLDYIGWTQALRVFVPLSISDLWYKGLHPSMEIED